MPGSPSTTRTGSGPRCPLPGTVVAVHVSEGDEVAGGHRLMVVEAMKMEHKIVAAASAVVEQVRFAVGDRVDEGSARRPADRGRQLPGAWAVGRRPCETLRDLHHSRAAGRSTAVRFRRRARAGSRPGRSPRRLACHRIGRVGRAVPPTSPDGRSTPPSPRRRADEATDWRNSIPGSGTPRVAVYFTRSVLSCSAPTAVRRCRYRAPAPPSTRR